MFKLSIITINYNNSLGLQKTIESVVKQSYTEFDYIVIDGGSNDDSVSIIKKYTNKINYWVSEADKGVYDAMNKGILKANGDYLLFLNSGDSFYGKDVLENFRIVTDQINTPIIYGNSNFTCSGKKDWVQCPPGSLNKNYWFRYTLNHQATFIKRTLFNDFGSYNTDFPFLSDFEFFLKVFLKHGKDAFYYTNTIICNYDESGLSSKPENFKKLLSEKEKILRIHFTVEEYNNLKQYFLSTVSLPKRVLFKIYFHPFLFNIINGFFPYFHWIIKKKNYTVE